MMNPRREDLFRAVILEPPEPRPNRVLADPNLSRFLLADSNIHTNGLRNSESLPPHAGCRFQGLTVVAL